MPNPAFMSGAHCLSLQSLRGSFPESSPLKPNSANACQNQNITPGSTPAAAPNNQVGIAANPLHVGHSCRYTYRPISTQGRFFSFLVAAKEYRLQHQEGQSREIVGTGTLVPDSHKPAW